MPLLQSHHNLGQPLTATAPRAYSLQQCPSSDSCRTRHYEETACRVEMHA